MQFFVRIFFSFFLNVYLYFWIKKRIQFDNFCIWLNWCGKNLHNARKERWAERAAAESFRASLQWVTEVWECSCEMYLSGNLQWTNHRFSKSFLVIIKEKFPGGKINMFLYVITQIFCSFHNLDALCWWERTKRKVCTLKDLVKRK